MEGGLDRYPVYSSVPVSPAPTTKHGVYPLALPYLAQVQGLFPEVSTRGDGHQWAGPHKERDWNKKSLEHD